MIKAENQQNESIDHQKTIIKKNVAVNLDQENQASQPVPITQAKLEVSNPSPTSKIKESTSKIQSNQSEEPQLAKAIPTDSIATPKIETGEDNNKLENQTSTNDMIPEKRIVAAQPIEAKPINQALIDNKQDSIRAPQKNRLTEPRTADAIESIEPVVNSTRSKVNTAPTHPQQSTRQPPTQKQDPTPPSIAGGSKRGMRSYQDLRQMPGNPVPQYPAQSRMRREQGDVLIKYFVSSSGRVTELQLIRSSGHPLLDREAIQAASQYRFVPGQAGWTLHPVSFVLTGQDELVGGRLRTSMNQ